MVSYEDLHIKLYNKDCLSMSELADESVQMVCTSPPYWGLRKYSGVPDLVWGDNDCGHKWGIPETKSMEYVQGNPEFARPHREHKNFTSTTNTCQLCGAWKGSYGLEPNPDCGRPFAKLRDDLSNKEVEYVMGELKRCGLL